MDLDVGEVRVTDPTTGGAKGSKLARFDLIPPDILLEDAEHYGKGEAKYPSDERGQPNWTRGYKWSLSIAALQRHLNAWLSGESLDPETGSSHLTAVRWHCAALRTFEKNGLGRDDRLATVLAEAPAAPAPKTALIETEPCPYASQGCKARIYYDCTRSVYVDVGRPDVGHFGPGQCQGMPR